MFFVLFIDYNECLLIRALFVSSSSVVDPLVLVCIEDIVPPRQAAGRRNEPYADVVLSRQPPVWFCGDPVFKVRICELCIKYKLLDEILIAVVIVSI